MQKEPDTSNIEKKPISKSTIAKPVQALGRRRTVTSIKSLQKEIINYKKQDEVEEDLTSKPRTPFTIEDLMKYWIQYADLKKQKGRAGYYSTLINHKPKLDSETFLINLELDNLIQKHEIDEDKSEFLSFLRNKTNNFGILLNVCVSKNDDKNVKTEFLSDKEMFLKMSEKNPNLKDLKTNFKLDIEY